MGLRIETVFSRHTLVFLAWVAKQTASTTSHALARGDNKAPTSSNVPQTTELPSPREIFTWTTLYPFGGCFKRAARGNETRRPSRGRHFNRTCPTLRALGLFLLTSIRGSDGCRSARGGGQSWQWGVLLLSVFRSPAKSGQTFSGLNSKIQPGNETQS